MKIMYFHCFSGVSGDMILGSLVDAGLNLEDLKNELNKLNIEGFEIKSHKVTKRGISGAKIDIITDEKNSAVNKSRNLKDIYELLEKSYLEEKVIKKSKEVFKKLATAEAKIHNTSIDKVHFHEVGAMDSIIDIVGSVVGIESFKVDKIVSSPLHLGKGFINSSHGKIPVPAPATLELTKNIPVYSEGIESELTTPTGAAILVTLSHFFDNFPSMTPKSIGYGAGNKDLIHPNLLRVVIGREIKGKSPEEKDTVSVIEANIDDMNPEHYQNLMELCLENGALDIYFTPVYMKKNRPATLVTALAPHEHKESITEIILKNTTSIGVRKYTAERKKLDRKTIAIDTALGRATIKIGIKNNKLYNFTPEYERALLLARENEKTLKEVYSIINQEFLNKKEKLLNNITSNNF